MSRTWGGWLVSAARWERPWCGRNGRVRRMRYGGRGAGERAALFQEGRPSFLKKRSKRLLTPLSRTVQDRSAAAESKVFWFFFSKKNCLLSATWVSLSAIGIGSPIRADQETPEVRRTAPPRLPAS